MLAGSVFLLKLQVSPRVRLRDRLEKAYLPRRRRLQALPVPHGPLRLRLCGPADTSHLPEFVSWLNPGCYRIRAPARACQRAAVIPSVVRLCPSPWDQVSTLALPHVQVQGIAGSLGTLIGFVLGLAVVFGVEKITDRIEVSQHAGVVLPAAERADVDGFVCSSDVTLVFRAG